MEESISNHLNPMAQKRSKLFNKKSKLAKLSFFSSIHQESLYKPDLSITKASNRLTIDKNHDRRISFDSSERNNQSFSSGMTSTKNTRPKPLAIHKGLSSRKQLKKSQLLGILQTVESNNRKITQLFGYDEQMALIKQEIRKTMQMYQEMQVSLEKRNPQTARCPQNATTTESRSKAGPVFIHAQNQNENFDLKILCRKSQLKSYSGLQQSGSGQKSKENSTELLKTKVKAVNRNLKEHMNLSTRIQLCNTIR